MEILKGKNPKDMVKRAGIFSATTSLVLATAFLPHPAQAGEGIILTPPKGSVTPQASGFVEVEVLSRNSDNLIKLHIKGDLEGLIPNRTYQPWVCWDTPADCSTQGAGVKTDKKGLASFDEEVNVFNRPNHPIASIRIAQVAEGEVPADACFLVSVPCLSALYSVNP